MASEAGPGASSSQVKSATRTLDIIEYVVAHNRPLVAQEIATALGIPVSSLSYLLSTLVDRQYLVRDGRRYSAGPGLARLQASTESFTLADRAAPLVRTLRVQLDETTSFFIRVDWEIEAIVTESSEQALRYSVPQGRRLPMHALAAGKVLLAALEPEELERYFAETERAPFTNHTVTDEPTLRKQLDEARKTGFAMTDEEFSLGIVGIGRLVTMDGAPVGSLSVAVPKVRFTDDLHARVADLLDRTASLLEDS
ncbi:IclR family transcriptional regulator [Alteraurantiacibacter aquimixticola]|uniref:IclR family transcriptional regulator n=1 Tax=Alteraurantiacibacter aquimixticola TaxID=2489173 RepID=A0A4T3EY44_9SPHN|nr:IclR family transcriptional regulator [Alteraurantiacibacter aquimixticola]TIX49568.1 IclR family transcriptional regulator [Alteraurantiacibacter aquimixticola]